MKDNNLPDDCQGNGAHLPWNEPEQELSATELLNQLAASDDEEIVIGNEPVTLECIVSKYLDRSELEELAVNAVRGNQSAVRKVFIDAIARLQE